MKSLESLITLLAKLPGLGPRSARRIALHLIKDNRQFMMQLAETIHAVAEEIKTCAECGNIDTVSPCSICADPKRDSNIICVVEGIADLWAMERGHVFNGLYHVLGGSLSAIDGRTPEKLNLKKLRQRVTEGNLRELIIATNATLEGQTTGHYIVDMLADTNLKISCLAHGIPVGAELDYVDEGTLTLALKQRHNYDN
jgi:recombination protein RecR